MLVASAIGLTALKHALQCFHQYRLCEGDRLANHITQEHTDEEEGLATELAPSEPQRAPAQPLPQRCWKPQHCLCLSKTVAAREFFELDATTHTDEESDESALHQAGLGRDAVSEVTVGDEATGETTLPLAVKEEETELFYVLPGTSQGEEGSLRNLADREKASEDLAPLFAAHKAGGGEADRRRGQVRCRGQQEKGRRVEEERASGRQRGA